MLKLGQDWGWILTHPFFPQIIIIIIIIYHFQIFLCNYDPPHHHPLYQITHPPTYTLIHTFQSSHSTLEWWSNAKYLFSKWRWLPGCPPNNFHLIIFWRQRRNTAAYLPTVHSLWPWFARAGNVTLHVCAMHTSRTVQEIFLLTLFFLFIFFYFGEKKNKREKKEDRWHEAQILVWEMRKWKEKKRQLQVSELTDTWAFELDSLSLWETETNSEKACLLAYGWVTRPEAESSKLAGVGTVTVNIWNISRTSSENRTPLWNPRTHLSRGSPVWEKHVCKKEPNVECLRGGRVVQK